jgi:hypothetical protein
MMMMVMMTCRNMHSHVARVKKGFGMYKRRTDETSAASSLTTALNDLPCQTLTHHRLSCRIQQSPAREQQQQQSGIVSKSETPEKVKTQLGANLLKEEFYPSRLTTLKSLHREHQQRKTHSNHHQQRPANKQITSPI